MKEVVILLYNENDENQTYYIHIQDSNAEVFDPDSDACIDYTIYNQDKDEIDGGQIDYNSEELKVNSIEDLIPTVLSEIANTPQVPMLYEDMIWEVIAEDIEDFL